MLEVLFSGTSYVMLPGHWIHCATFLHTKLVIPGHFRPRLELPSYLIKFFLCQLKKVEGFELITREDWMVQEHFLLIGLYRQDIELVKLALEVGSPSLLLLNFSGVSKDLHSPHHWPRKKGDVEAVSFNSCEYYLIFTNLLFNSILRAYYQKLKLEPECLSLLWREVSMPHLPVADMQKAFDKTSYSKLTVDEKSFISSYFEKSLLEDFSEQYKPRTLKHLCRSAARKHCSLPERIEHLPVPISLKKYVNLEF